MILGIFYDGPAITFLIAFNCNDSVCIGCKDDFLAVFINDRVLIRIQQCKYSAAESLGHVAGFIFEQVDTRNAARTAAAVMALCGFLDIVGKA